MSKNTNANSNTTAADAQRKATNLRVLQRLDGSIVDLIGSATHVVVYAFKQSETTTATAGEWEKCDMEGPLFIVSCGDQKRYKLIVLNRNSTINLIVPLEENIRISCEKPLLILSFASKIHGFWFHKDEERTTTHALMERMLCLPENEENSSYKKNTAAELDKEIASSLPPQNNGASSVAPLDKKNLQLTLLSLIQDDRFIELIHSHYVKIVEARGKSNNE